MISGIDLENGRRDFPQLADIPNPKGISVHLNNSMVSMRVCKDGLTLSLELTPDEALAIATLLAESKRMVSAGILNGSD